MEILGRCCICGTTLTKQEPGVLHIKKDGTAGIKCGFCDKDDKPIGNYEVPEKHEIVRRNEKNQAASLDLLALSEKYRDHFGLKPKVKKKKPPLPEHPSAS